MAVFGSVALLTALGAAGWVLLVSLIGGPSRPELAESRRAGCYAIFAAIAAANVAMLVAFLSDTFAIRYVAENSSRATPAFYKALALWGGDSGSLLLWNLILAGYGAVLAFRYRHGNQPELRWATAIVVGVQVFYLLLVVIAADPFETTASAPPDGQGLEPLLRTNVLMAVHPPTLYLGLIGLTVPFAIAAAGLVCRERTDWWVRAARRWALVAWSFLTGGLVLGALWSYGVLGWGGYWAWDPVENAALLPWLTTTAYLHSARLRERRGILRIGTPGLMFLTFALSVLGTGLTRGSVLTSVHTFSASPFGPMYLGFLVLVVVGAGWLLGWRGSRSPTHRPFEFAASKETLLLAGNLLLLALAATVLAGTLYPLIVEAVSGTQVSVGRPFFEQLTAPLLLVLLLLTGLGPLLGWRSSSPRQVLSLAVVPIAGAGLALLLVRIPGPALSVAIAIGVFVVLANLVTRRGPGGARLAHIGLAIVAVGIVISSGLSQRTDASLTPGQVVSFAGHSLRYDRLVRHDEPDRTLLSAELTDVSASASGHYAPALATYPGRTEPTGLPAIDRGLLTDVYVAVLAVEPATRTVDLRIHVNPGMTLLWLGGAVVAGGGLLACLPRRRGSPAGRGDRATANPALPAGVR